VKIIKKNIAEGDLDRFSYLRQIPRASPFFLFWFFFLSLSLRLEIVEKISRQDGL